MFQALKTLAQKASDAWTDAITEPNNQTVCPVRLGAFGTAIVYHAAAAYMVFGQSTKVDMSVLGAYVTHMAGLLAVTSGSAGIKSLMKGDAPKE
jgi:hypothetical protein